SVHMLGDVADVAYRPTHSRTRPRPFAKVARTGPVNGALATSRVSVGPVTVSVAVFDVPPPGAGVTTVIARVPPLARSAAVSCAVSCVADPVVGRAVPSTYT